MKRQIFVLFFFLQIFSLNGMQQPGRKKLPEKQNPSVEKFAIAKVIDQREFDQVKNAESAIEKRLKEPKKIKLNISGGTISK